MKIGEDCKAIIDSMNLDELMAYKYFLEYEIGRHQKAMTDNLGVCKYARTLTKVKVFNEATVKLNQTAIYRHRQDIKSTRECILKAEDRMDMLELLS